MGDVELVVLSPLAGLVRSKSRIVLTKKFIDGMTLFQELWGENVLHFCEPATKESDNLDNVEISCSEPFQTVCDEFSAEKLRRLLTKRTIVLASLTHRYNAVSAICRELGVASVYISENTLESRIQQAKEQIHSKFRRMRTVRWEQTQEEKQVRALALANGVQCNGVPTYEAYKSLTPSTLLFFDTRMNIEQLPSEDEVRQRYGSFRDRPLHLVFSGRITLIKGVDDLVRVVGHLKAMGISTKMSICGDGDYLPSLKEFVKRTKLEEYFEFLGSLDFNTGLVPFMKEKGDLFVCCHRQGDPSCTYLETMACGVPIAGYSNEAFAGLVRASGVGLTAPVGDPLALANKIRQLSKSTSIPDMALRSLSFARNHTFRKTFEARVEHLRGIVTSLYN